uniref:Uncharacterized protein n=1 Tax=Glossina austeni TaxID=7395 RepID=A0A1A9V242_GLOAU
MNQLRNPDVASQIFGFSAACYRLMGRRLELNLPAPPSLKDCRPIKDIMDHSPKSWLKKAVATLNEEDNVKYIENNEYVYIKIFGVEQFIFSSASVGLIRIEDVNEDLLLTTGSLEALEQY